MDLARRLYGLSLRSFYCFPAWPVPVEGVVVWRVVAELPKHTQDAGVGHQPNADSTEPDQVCWHGLCLPFIWVGLVGFLVDSPRAKSYRGGHPHHDIDHRLAMNQGFWCINTVLKTSSQIYSIYIIKERLETYSAMESYLPNSDRHAASWIFSDGPTKPTGVVKLRYNALKLFLYDVAILRQFDGPFPRA